MSDDSTVRLQRCLDRLQAGDESARRELLAGSCDRLLTLTRAMLRDYRRVKRWEETDDVVQNAIVRLHRALQTLPAEEQEVFDLVWYQGLTHADAANLLGVATKTIQRRWHAACRRLHNALGGELPG